MLKTNYGKKIHDLIDLFLGVFSQNCYLKIYKKWKRENLQKKVVNGNIKRELKSSEKEILHDKIERDRKSERLEGKTAKDAIRRKK